MKEGEKGDSSYLMGLFTAKCRHTVLQVVANNK